MAYERLRTVAYCAFLLVMSIEALCGCKVEVSLLVHSKRNVSHSPAANLPSSYQDPVHILSCHCAKQCLLPAKANI